MAGMIRQERELKIVGTADVVVAGGGPAGLGAAVSAARQGKRVLLLEKRGFLGGNITACYVENCNYFLKDTEFQPQGLYAQIEKECYEKYGNENLRSKNKMAYHSEYLKVYLDELMEQENVTVWFHSFVNEVILENDRIRALVLQTKKGPAAVAATVFIDATGDGDVAFAAGVDFAQGRESDGLCQPGTTNVRFAGVDYRKLAAEPDRLSQISHEFTRLSAEGKTGLSGSKQDIPFGRVTLGGQLSYVNYSCAHRLDPTDVKDLSKGEIACRKQIIEIHQYLKHTFDEFSNSEIASIAPEIGFRDSRRIQGEYCLKLEDMESGRDFDDTIAVFPRFYDMLPPDDIKGGDGKVEGKGYRGHIFEPITDNRTFHVPYRILVPRGITNLLVAGRCVSADHVAESGLRAVSLCMMMGEAAGAAAALSLKDNGRVAAVDVKYLQKLLINQGFELPKQQGV